MLQLADDYGAMKKKRKTEIHCEGYPYDFYDKGGLDLCLCLGLSLCLGGVVVSALDFSSEDRWFEAQSLRSRCFFRQEAPAVWASMARVRLDLYLTLRSSDVIKDGFLCALRHAN